MAGKPYSKRFSVILLPLWIASLFSFGLVFFTRGFLLVRIEIGNHSDVEFFSLTEKVESFDRFGTNRMTKDQLLTSGNWLKFDKALLIVIDSLRYDFILHNSNVTSSNSKHYQNKFTNLQKLMTESAENARAFKFIADPPTITVQRLKGLTTGSLPTFADARTNFGGDEILEDNLIYQFNQNNKSVVFMGDESWVNLYPRQFKRELPFPGLDVKDLDTLDNNVKRHLLPEMSKSDWNVLIAHFLGVDHCGHTFGPDHPEMERKLKEMDQVLKEVIENLDNETILYVFGDHGMTQTGDHGGETHDEAAAALFIYSKKKIFPTGLNAKTQDVSQVDIVPTLSLQMGVPIPFANIGTIIEDLFLAEQNQTNSNSESQMIRQNINKMLALRINARQVMLYLEEYAKVSQDIAEDRFLALKEIFIEAEQSFARLSIGDYSADQSEELFKNIDMIKTTQHQYRRFVRKVLSTCREIWAKFDLVSMTLGLVLITLTLAVCVLILSQIYQMEITNRQNVTIIQLLGLFLNIVAWVLLAFTSISNETSMLLTSIQATSLLCLMLVFWPKEKTWLNFESHFFRTRLDGLSFFILIFYVGSFSANSFVQSENSLLLGLIQTLLLCRIAIHVSAAIEITPVSELKLSDKISSKKRNKKKESEFKTNWEYIFRAICLLVASICTRLSKNFWNCREELKDCEISEFLRPMEILIFKDYSMFQFRFSLAIASVFGLVGFFYYWCKKGGHLIGNSSVYMSARLLFPISGLCILLHWTLKSADHKKYDIFNIIWTQQVFFPRVVYIACLLVVVFLIWDPLAVYMLIRNQSLEEKLASGNFNENIHAVFRDIKNRFNERISSRQQEQESLPPLVYGLGTVYTTAFMSLIVALALVSMILLTDAFAPSVALLLISMLCLVLDESFGNTSNKGLPLSSMVTWSLVSSYWFFAVGHQATIPSIRFDAAFVGRQGDSGARFFPGLMIFLNTFACQALCSVALPLLCIWSVSKHGSTSKWIPHGNSKPEETNEIGEMILRENPSETTKAILMAVFSYMIIRMFKVGAAASIVALHRRHPFIWSVFGPRFIFEATGFLVSFPFLLAGSLFFFRIDYVLAKWTIKLEEISKLA